MPAPEYPNSSRSSYTYKNQSNFTKQEKARICPDAALPTAGKIQARAAETPVCYRYSITLNIPQLLRSQPCTGSLSVLFCAWSGAIAKVQIFWCGIAPRWKNFCGICGTPLMGYFLPHIRQERERLCSLFLLACVLPPSCPTELLPLWKCECFFPCFSVFRIASTVMHHACVPNDTTTPLPIMLSTQRPLRTRRCVALMVARVRLSCAVWIQGRVR